LAVVWQLLNNTPFAASRGLRRDRTGAELWLGVLRASFDVGADGALKRAPKQTPPRRTAEWYGEPGLSSLRDEPDFCLGRLGTDVLVHGHAHAPQGRPVAAVDVALRGPGLDKRVRVHGPRVWVEEGAAGAVVPGAAQPFERVPLIYEHAFGGADREGPEGAAPRCEPNPVGAGFCHEPRRLLGTPAPHVEYPGVVLRAGPVQVAPPGFAPIAPHWQPRMALAGTYDEAWQQRRAPLLPDDYDDSFCRSAPPDQQLPGFLRGGELFELEHMTPEPSFALRLPELEVSMVTSFVGGSELTVADLHSVRIYPSERRLELTWHAAVPCQGKEHTIERATIHCRGDRSCQLP